MAYFERRGEQEFVPTQQTGGAWRLSYDILGPIPIEPMHAEVAVLRPGRAVELVEATLRHDGRPALRLRAWLLRTSDTLQLAGTPTAPLPPPSELERFDPTTVWAGDFIASLEVWRHEREPGAAQFWLRAGEVLLAEEEVSPLARAAGLFDVANGMAIRALPEAVAFPNVDLTAHLHRLPVGEWVGFDTQVTFGVDGVGLTSSVLHDERGPLGTVNQILTLAVQP